MDQRRTPKVPLWTQTIWKKLEENLRPYLNQNQHPNTITCTKVFHQGQKTWTGWRLKRNSWTQRPIQVSPRYPNLPSQQSITGPGKASLFFLFRANRPQLQHLSIPRHILRLLDNFNWQSFFNVQTQIMRSADNPTWVRAGLEKDKFMQRGRYKNAEFKLRTDQNIIFLFRRVPRMSWYIITNW